MRQRISGRTALCALLLGSSLAAPAGALAAEGDTPLEEARYQLRAVRIEHSSSAVLYRLDRSSGEVCAFGFMHPKPGELRGCLAAGDPGAPGRFSIEAIQGARGTSQSSAYRLDRLTGEICRFRLPATSDASLEFVGCIGLAAGARSP